MSVYFCRPIDRTDMLKIGTTEDIDARLTALASQVGPIELLAVCDGGTEVDGTFHRMFAESWLEGEWYRESDLLLSVVQKFAKNVSGKRVWGRTRAIEAMDRSPIEEDKAIARDLLKRIMDSFGAESFGILLDRAYEQIHAVNPAWTRRRVRAIWHSETSRIDHFEIRDLQAVLTDIGAMPRGQVREKAAKLAEWICPELIGAGQEEEE